MKTLAAIFLGLFILTLVGVGGVFYTLHRFGRGLPEYRQLADYDPPVVTRIHAGDGRLMAEFATEKRVFVPVAAMPEMVVQAFLSAEDKTFYSHPGVDVPGIVRAAATNLMRLNKDRRPVGASTITQQVAKNFLIGNVVSIERKIKEVILAFRIERAFTKDRILELYLNEIYLGFGAYGAAAAALNYFDKSLDDLTLGEAAFLAGLPKAPNNYHPVRRPAAARARRDYVLNRMVEDGHISRADALREMSKPVVVRKPSEVLVTRADYFVEEVRRGLYERFGEDRLYGGGLSVRTTLDTRLQRISDRALRSGLSAYDRRRGWRGPLGRIESHSGWRRRLSGFPFPDDVIEWRPAVVLAVDRYSCTIGFRNGATGVVPLAELQWARRAGRRLGPAIRKARDVLSPGDVVAVEEVSMNAAGETYSPGTFALRQIPEVNGALVALDPHTGRVLAMTGGFSKNLSEFNRATQAMRQPGSAFKPFVYLAALDAGFTPASIVLDAPFAIDQGPGIRRWRPTNYNRKFYGPTSLRVGIEKSRNLMTVRLASNIGMETVARYAERFGIVDRMPPMLSMSLGSGETTLLRLTTAYAMLVNGGKRIRPTLIDKVQDRTGATVFRHDRRQCATCRAARWNAGALPQLPDEREEIADPRTAYQIVSMLQGVVERGTGRRVRDARRPLAGKTGTTNESRDAWFVGFSPDLAAGVFVGHDTPRSLGRAETGSSVAAPIFRQFMTETLEGQPAAPFRVPPGIRLVRLDLETGLPARPGARNVILEAFLPNTAPGDPAPEDPARPGAAGSRGRVSDLY